MKRRAFLSMAAGTGAALSVSRACGAPWAASDMPSRADARTTIGKRAGRLLVLIELKGGNDGLNTVIPFTDPAYYALRQHIAVPRGHAIALNDAIALHPSLHALLPLWRQRELAIVQGVGYPSMNASHFRSSQIWDTASCADAYTREGWLFRALSQQAPSDVAVSTALSTVGSDEPGPFAGGKPRNDASAMWPAVSDPDGLPSRWGADDDTVAPDIGLRDVNVNVTAPRLRTGTTFRDAIAAAFPALMESARRGTQGAIRLTLDGFDTHCNQPAKHAALLGQLAHGCAMLRAGLVRHGLWQDTLIVTYSEFGRAAHENAMRGTDHGGAAAHLVMGGRVKGGVYGAPPVLDGLAGDGHLPVSVDFRRLYATVLGPFWGLDPKAVLHDDLRGLALLRV